MPGRAKKRKRHTVRRLVWQCGDAWSPHHVPRTTAAVLPSPPLLLSLSSSPRVQPTTSIAISEGQLCLCVPKIYQRLTGLAVIDRRHHQHDHHEYPSYPSRPTPTRKRERGLVEEGKHQNPRAANLVELTTTTLVGDTLRADTRVPCGRVEEGRGEEQATLQVGAPQQTTRYI